MKSLEVQLFCDLRRPEFPLPVPGQVAPVALLQPLHPEPLPDPEDFPLIVGSPMAHPRASRSLLQAQTRSIRQWPAAVSVRARPVASPWVVSIRIMLAEAMRFAIELVLLQGRLLCRVSFCPVTDEADTRGLACEEGLACPTDTGPLCWRHHSDGTRDATRRLPANSGESRLGGNAAQW